MKYSKGEIYDFVNYLSFVLPLILNASVESKAAKDVKEYNKNLRKDLDPKKEIKIEGIKLNEKR